MHVKDKVVVVTGASYGIGEATARLLAQKGAKVALTARSTDKIKKISVELPGAFAVACDMSKEDEIKAMINTVKNRFGRIDVLVNNAGQGYGAPFEKIEIKKLRALYDLNVFGPFIAMQAVIPIMRQQGGGAIVNISSGTSLMYIPNLAGYSSTKRALNGLSLTARAELAKDNIVVTLVHPYITASKFYENAVTPAGGAPGHLHVTGGMPPADTSEYVAGKILDGIEGGEPEVFAHDWMKKPPAR